MICRIISRLPNIGERVMVQHEDTQVIPATIISMAECQSLEPDLFGERERAALHYRDDDIRAYRYDRPCNGRLAGFCIMRFRDGTNPAGHLYNRNILVPTTGELF